MALTLSVTALVAGPAAGALADQTAPERPPVKEYSVAIAKTTKSKQSVQASQGSYCLPAADGNGGTCHTASFPLPDLPTIRVSKGEQITLLFKVPVGYVTWRTARVNSRSGQEIAITTGEGEQVTKTKKRWRVTLPKNLRKSATILGLFVQYANAYNSFEVGLKVR
ncbi:MAG: hypothetical protein JWN65_164 [Solirubrobacterales bacterium]|nr:hypothetical protein [Solirubrobacterales bacterium]